MERMTLRDAAGRTGRSVTTLRRYIRSGRLHAEKAPGRYGPEYLISESELVAAGLHPGRSAGALQAPAGEAHPVARTFADSVPVGMYHELQMKHEQLLVQYGMVRAGGLRLLHLQGEMEERQRLVARLEADLAAARERAERESAVLRRKLREAELELEGKTLEAAALREKLRAYEMLSRGRTSPEELEHQLSRVAEQARRVERLESLRTTSSPSPMTKDPKPGEAEH